MTAIRTAALSAVVVVIVVLALLPFYVVLVFSLNDPSALSTAGVHLLPGARFSNFAEAWTASGIGRSMLNSLLITTGAIAVIVATGSAAGYSIARFPNAANRTMLAVFLASMMVPGIINTVPLYILMRSIGGINSRWAMSLLLAANALPFSVFLYTGFVRATPRGIEEAAIIDGCSWSSAFFRITFHFLTPVTAAVVILNGLSIWNNYAQAVFFLQREDVRTIPLSISLFFQQYGARWNLMSAAAILGVLPAVAGFLAFQRYFVKGIIAGSIKG